MHFRLALLGLALGLGCAGSVDPGDVAGRYRLTTVNGAAPPYLAAATVECDVYVTTGELALRPDGGFTLSQETANDCREDVLGHSRDISGVFHLEGRRIFLNGARTDGARVGMQGELRGAGFIVTVPWHDAGELPDLELGFEPEDEGRR